MEYGPALPDTRLVQQTQVDAEDEVDEELTPKAMSLYDEDLTAHAASESCSDAGTDPEVQKILEETEDTEIELTDETGNYWQEEENKRIIKKDRRSPADPKFIVTLDGVDPHTYRVLPEPRKNVVQTVVPVQKYEPAKVVEDIADQVKAAVESEEMYSKITPPKIKPFNINLKDTDDEEESEEIAMDTQEIQKSPVINEKCRFWPACANGNACQFIHPSIPCKTFPYCKFGDKCMYIHPNCKFDASCTRMDCPYTHATRRGGGFNKPTVIHQIVQVPVQKSYMPSVPQSAGLTAVQAPSIECKFFPNCRNMNCPFTHPKPCRYGIGCMNKSTCSFHHPPLPTMNKLKWTSSDKKETMGQPISISSSLLK